MCILWDGIILISILYNPDLDVVSHWEDTLYIFFFFLLVLIYLKFSRKRFLCSDSRKRRDGFAFLLERIVENHCETSWAIAVS